MASSSTDANESTARKSPKDAVSESPNSIPTLPSDIHEELIARLPLRSLIISTSICKSWYALLKNPYFASKHFQHTTAHTYFLFRRKQSGFNDHGRVSLVSSTESFDVPMNFNIPFLEISKLGLRICGSCNGLVCLSEGDNASIIILWNPITRVFKALPVSPVKRPNRSPWRVTLGFGFDPVANDFKLLRIVYYGYGEHYQVDIYSLSTNCWREIQPPQRFVIYQNAATMVAVNGRFHWKACDIEDLIRNSAGDLIATFDVSNEVFTYIKLPSLLGIHPEELDYDHDDDDDDDDDDDRSLGWELVVWKEDFLGLIIYPKFVSGRYFDMWVLDEYGVEKSWTKLFTFGQHTDVDKPLACKSNGEILLYNYNEQLVVYDSTTRTFNIVPVEGIPFGGQVFNYAGSLLPIEGGRTIEQANLAAVRPDPFFFRY